MKALILFVLGFLPTLIFSQYSYTIVDTHQSNCYDNSSVTTAPSSGSAFYGQDAQYSGNAPSYQDNGDGTITDLNTGLMWQQGFNYEKTYAEAVSEASTFNLAGHTDWRLPTIKELYSLIQFSGYDVSSWQDTIGAIPFIDMNYFPFMYGDVSIGDRIIDAQYWSSTEYVSTTMNGDPTTFGVNFADGRIKGYPNGPIGPPGNQTTTATFVKYVRGNTSYGINNFADNGDGTVTDQATGLMWMQNDSGHEGAGSSGDGTMNWEDALDWAENLTYAGYSDWRMPNAKELQSIIDYSRSPSTTNSAAIDPIFNTSVMTDEGGSNNYPFYWTNTTHASSATNGAWAVYLSFGEALGFMEMPPSSGTYTLLDVHGAGSQRSDPKDGNPSSYPNGWGPQGDVIRIFNYSRLVRNAPVGINETTPEFKFNLYPSPGNGIFNLSYSLSSNDEITVSISNAIGQLIDVLKTENQTTGNYNISFDQSHLIGGIYFVTVQSKSGMNSTKKLIVQ